MNNILLKIKQGEGINIEFKESKASLNKDLYETVCAFSNRLGGEIFLGVNDQGVILGVDSKKVNQLKKDFVTSINNPDRFFPPCYMNIKDYEINDKIILHILVPESSQVHRTNGKIFDRNEDGNMNITNNTDLVAQMFVRKQKSYTENHVYPYVTLEDLRNDLIEKVRKRSFIERADHPWNNMNDHELLRSAGMYLRDYNTGEEGFTLAAVLMFGKDHVIKSILPYHRVDALMRKVNIDRYDDRDDIRTNLLDSYERLISFVHKHLPDKFYLEGTQRVSIRDIIFREIITNLLIHREYSNAYPSKLIIGFDEIIAENASKPHGYGPIDPNSFSPYPKNPVIAGVFKEMGLIDELGSGVRNLYKYSRLYFGNDPKLVEGDVFRMSVKVEEAKATQQATQQAGDREALLLYYCKQPRTRSEMQGFLQIVDREYFRTNVLNPLIKKGLIQLTIPDKPSSPKQKYLVTTNDSK